MLEQSTITTVLLLCLKKSLIGYLRDGGMPIMGRIRDSLVTSNNEMSVTYVTYFTWTLPTPILRDVSTTKKPIKLAVLWWFLVLLRCILGPYAVPLQHMVLTIILFGPVAPP